MQFTVNSFLGIILLMGKKKLFYTRQLLSVNLLRIQLKKCEQIEFLLKLEVCKQSWFTHLYVWMIHYEC